MVTKDPITDTKGNGAPIDREHLEAEFVGLLRARWAHGAVAYGDQSFEKPLAVTADEVLQELVDAVAWGFVAWAQTRSRLQAATHSAASIETMLGKVRELQAERDALRHQLAEVRETLAAAPQCPTWAALAGLVAKATRLAAEEGRS